MRLPMLRVFLWLLPALTTSSHEMLSLQPSASVSAACGQRAALNCAVSSSLHGLSVKHMEWTLDHSSLCSVDKHGNVTNRHGNGPSGHFHCEYATGRLVLVLHRVRPKDAGDYMCKLKSNRGAKHINTRVELQECCGDVHTQVAAGSSTCTFQRVHLGGDVRWFHGQHGKVRLHEDVDTSSVVDGDGWWTISSTLQRPPSHRGFTCSLVSRSGKNLRSALVQAPPPSTTPRTRNTGAGLLASAWSLLCVSIYTLL